MREGEPVIRALVRVGNQELRSLVPFTLIATLTKCAGRLGAQTLTPSDGSSTQTSSVSSAHQQVTAMIPPFSACKCMRRHTQAVRWLRSHTAVLISKPNMPEEADRL